MKLDWIAVDWGTSNLRAWAIGADGILAAGQSDEGMGKLLPAEFEAALLRVIAPWLSTEKTLVIASGMVGARQGWREAPYLAVPCAPIAADGLVTAPTTDPRLDVRIVAGLKQLKPADVMRGEETQIAGALALLPQFDGVICLPGTHSKWVHVSAGEVVSFQTFMTGELFALLSKSSVLQHSLKDPGWDAPAFEQGVADGISRPERISARLFTLRAESLLNGLDSASARARLSGLLIGVELAAAKPYWLGQRVMLLGDAGLVANYQAALGAQAVQAEVLDAAACTLAGLAAAQALWKKETA